ncbi:MAG: glycosyltransferase [Proteobacteria bacterium]|nr:glycosyltransferase [Pseudomonadota bacterium]
MVSDDCSTDDSVEYLKLSYPEIKIVSTLKNTGFATACNTGIAETRYSYTCIVNTDVTFDSNFFKNAVKYFENPNLFAIKGDIVNYREQPENILNIDKDIVVYFKRGFFKFTAAEKRNTVNYDNILVLLGCCFVCRTDLIKTMGGFDERFSPYFWEDLRSGANRA